jgi:hypothetical protein
MNTVDIGYITYNIIESRTPEDMEQAGHPLTAQAMRGNRIIADLILQRPKGTRYYHAVQWESGAYSAVTTLF